MLQAEPNLCFGTMVLYRSVQAAEAFLPAIRRRCEQEKTDKAESICAVHCYEQFAFYREVFRTIGLAGVPTAVCMDHDPYCQLRLSRSGVGGVDVLAKTDWPAIRFVPWNGTRDSPQLHNCLDAWDGCSQDGEALWFHTGHAGFARRSDLVRSGIKGEVDKYKARPSEKNNVKY